LEQYQLDQLQFVGTLEQENLWALIRTPEGTIHRVKKGNYLGTNNGLIEVLTDSKIKLKEIVPNQNGGFVERETILAVVEVN
jgi:type IV pilus assembly protein PilP